MNRENSSLSQASSMTGNGTSSLPDFHDIQKKYTKRILLGRHPRSFKRQSELWYHCNLSNESVSRINKGHKLWNVTDELDKRKQEIAEANYLLSQSNSGNELVDENGVPIPIMQTTEKKKVLESLNGISVDMKSAVRLHFGMNFFIMNYMDEILCVNKFDEVLCKPQNKLLQSDKITFKLIDLDDPTNPGAVKYGDPLWLQVIDNSPIADNSLNNGFVVGSQLFGPPEMGSVHKSKVDQQAAKPVKRDELPSLSRKQSNSNLGNVPSAPAPIADAKSAPLSRVNSGVNTVSTENEENESLEDADTHADVDAKSNGKHQATEKKELVEICGGLKTLKITGVTKEVAFCL